MDLKVIRYLQAKRWYIVPAQSITQDSLHRNQLDFHFNHSSIYAQNIDLKQHDFYHFDSTDLEGHQICINPKNRPIIFKYSYPDKESSDKIQQLYNGYLKDANKDPFGRLNRFKNDTASVKTLNQGAVIAELFINEIV
jgi:hypothetical protein